MICPYCESQIPDTETCPVCHQKIIKGVDFEKPLEKLMEIGSKMIRKDSFADHFLVQKEYDKIVEEIQGAIDEVTEAIEKNILELSKEREDLEKKARELNLDTVLQLLEEFDEAQRQVTENLNLIKETLINAKTPEEVRQGLTQYSKAVSEIASGVASLETLMAESYDEEFLTSPPEDIEFPKSFYKAQREIEKASDGLDAFEEEEDLNYIKFAIKKLDEAKYHLQKLMEEYQEEEEEEPLDEDVEVEEEVDEEIDEEEAEELIYTDPDEIVDEEDLKYMAEAPVEDYKERIKKDKDWQKILRGENDTTYVKPKHEPQEEMDEETIEETEPGTTISNLASVLSRLRETHSEDA